MGLAKLNVWFRDERCRPFTIRRPTANLDWVKIRNCHGEVVKQVTMPVARAR